MASHIHRIIIFSHRHSNTKEDSPSYSHTLRTCATLPSLAKLQGGHVSYELCGLPSHPLICHNMLSRVTICGCIVLCCVRHDSCSYNYNDEYGKKKKKKKKRKTRANLLLACLSSSSSCNTRATSGVRVSHDHL